MFRCKSLLIAVVLAVLICACGQTMLMAEPVGPTGNGDDPVPQSLTGDGANRTYMPAEILGLQEVQALQYTYSIRFLEWSPDGDHLVVTMSYHPVSHELYLYSFNGTTLTYMDSLNFDTNHIKTAWSPNGSYLAFGSDKTALGLRIYSFNGTALNLVTSAAFQYVIDLDWTPDGRHLAVSGRRTTNEHLAVYSFNGTTLTHVDSHDLEYIPQETDWNTDGTALAVVQSWMVMIDPETHTNYGKAFILSFNGSALVEEWSKDMGERAICVDWSPYGGHIAIGWNVGGGNFPVGVFSVLEDPYGTYSMALVGSFNYGDGVRSVAWSLNDHHIFFTGWRANAQLGMATFDGDDLDWEKSWSITGRWGYSDDIALSSDGMYLAVGGASATNSIDGMVYRVEYGPLSTDDDFVTNEDAPSTLDVLANDRTITGTLDITNITQSTNGTVQITPDGLDLLYTPPANWSGNVSFTYRHSDMYDHSPSVVVNITVLPVNDIPVISTTDVEEATEDEMYSVQYSATDADIDDALSWSAEFNAEWLDFNGATMVLSGIPTNDDVGSYLVNMSVTDTNGTSGLHSFLLTVVNVNDDPEITTEDVTDVDEDQLYSAYYKADDIDPTHDVLVWSIDTDADWLDMHDNHLTGTPTNEDVGEHVVNVTVSDGNGGGARREFTITVVNVNDAPRIVTVPSSLATEDEEYNVTFEALEIDVGDSLTWSMTGSFWLEIVEDTGVLSGTPTNDDVGIHFLTVTVSDGALEDTLSYAIKVENSNDAPVWVAITDDQELMEGEMMFLEVFAEDEDRDTLIYSLSSDPSSDITITQVTGTIRWLEAIPGTYDVEVTATDGTDTISHAFTIEVEAEPEPPEPPANKVPVIADVGVLNVTAGEAFHLSLMGSDGDEWDEDNLTFSLVNGPVGMVISHDGKVLWLPDDITVGIRYVTVELTDGKDEAELSFEVEVLEVVVDDGDTSDVEDGGDYLWLVVALVVVVLLLVVIMLWQYMGQRETPVLDATDEDDGPEDMD